jgi:membrane associated rhomboid family serine protease
MLLGQDGNSLIMMIAILALVFCIFKFIYITYYLSGLSRESFYSNIFDWFILPAEVDRIFDRPWTVLSYMFMHDGVFHMLGNVLWLWAFGYILQDLAGNTKLVPLFLYGGVAGAFLFVATNNLFPVLAAQIEGRTLQGASAGVMAIAIATTALAPDYRIFPMLNGGIPLWILTIIFVIIDFASIPSENGGGHIAHIGGAVMGLVFVLQLKRGNDWSAWMTRFFNWCGNLFNPDKKDWKKTAKKELHYKTKGTLPYKKVSNITQKRIDEILDKINIHGFKFLTDEEKEILKRASEDEHL